MTITAISNGESGLSVRTKLNSTIAIANWIGDGTLPSLTFTPPSAASAEKFAFTGRAGVGIPVPYFQPTTALTQLAFDIMPKGAAPDANTSGGLGPTWIDICQNDVITDDPTYECLRLSKMKDSYSHVSSAKGSAGTVRDLMFQIYGGNVGIGQNKVTNTAGWGSTSAVLTLSGATNSVLELATSAADADATLAGLFEFVSTTQTTGWKELGGIYGYTSGSTATKRGGELRLATQIDNGALTFRWKLTNTGLFKTYNGTEGLSAAWVAYSVPVTKTGTSGSVGAGDGSLIINASGGYTLTLPAATGDNVGRILHIKSIAAQTITSASSNVVPRNSSTAGTALIASGAGNWVILQSDGTNWVIMAGS